MSIEYFIFNKLGRYCLSDSNRTFDVTGMREHLFPRRGRESGRHPRFLLRPCSLTGKSIDLTNRRIQVRILVGVYNIMDKILICILPLYKLTTSFDIRVYFYIAFFYWLILSSTTIAYSSKIRSIICL